MCEVSRAPCYWFLAEVECHFLLFFLFLFFVAQPLQSKQKNLKETEHKSEGIIINYAINSVKTEAWQISTGFMFSYSQNSDQVPWEFKNFWANLDLLNA